MAPIQGYPLTEAMRAAILQNLPFRVAAAVLPPGDG